MPHSNFVQSNFLGGEWSAFSQGRIDKPEYKTGMNVCRNGFPIEEGAWLRRSGTRFAATTRNGAGGKLIKFDFQENAPYQMEFTDGALRMFGVSGQTAGLTNPLPKDLRLVTTNDNQQVSNISTANPAEVTTASAHGWSTADQVVFLFDSSATSSFIPLIKNRVFAITRTGATTFTLSDPITGLTIDGSTLGGLAITLGWVVVARVLTLTTPYVNGSWSSLRHVQAETESILLHGSYKPRALNVATLPTASAFATFTLASVTFTDGPYLDPPTDASTLTPSAKTGSINLTASAVTSINGGTGFVSTDIGRLVRLLSEPPAWNVATAYVVGNSVKFNGAYFTCTVGNTGQQPDIAIAYWSIDTAAATWSWAQITAITSPTIAVATIKGVDLLYTGAISIWRLGVYSDTTGWPKCGVYYEGRIWLSGAISNRVDASVVNAIANGVIDMTPTATDGTVADNNAISYIFNCDDVNPVFWMEGTDTGIVCGTQAGEWTIRASQLSDPITPTSIQAHRGTKYGCANVEPEHTELTISFVHRYGRKILEFFPDVFSGRYTAPNLSQNAKHLTKSGIKEIRYQHDLLPIIWARCGDGSLIGCTYKRSSLFSTQGPEFNGWHRHDLGSGRVVESISVGPSIDGTLDSLAMITNDTATNVRHVEVMENIFDIDDDITSGWLVDDAVVPNSGAVTISGGASTLTLYGLWHLNGETVTVCAGGIDCGDYVVSNGSVAVSIDYDLAASSPDTPLTSKYLISISQPSAYGAFGTRLEIGGNVYYAPLVVGFTYTSQGQIMRPDMADDVKSPQGPGSAKPSRVFQFGALLAGTQGISFGTDFTSLLPAIFNTDRGDRISNLDLYSGVYWGPINDTYSFESMICWEVSRPYPAAVMYVTGFMDTVER